MLSYNLDNEVLFILKICLIYFEINSNFSSITISQLYNIFDILLNLDIKRGTSSFSELLSVKNFI